MKKQFLLVSILLILTTLVSCSMGNEKSNSSVQTWESSNGITLVINNDDLVVKMIGQETTYGRIDRAITSGGTYQIRFELGGQLYGGNFVVSTNLQTATMGGVYYVRK